MDDDAIIVIQRQNTLEDSTHCAIAICPGNGTLSAAVIRGDNIPGRAIIPDAPPRCE